MRLKKAFFCLVLVCCLFLQGCATTESTEPLQTEGEGTPPTSSRPVKEPVQAEPMESGEGVWQKNATLSRQLPESQWFQAADGTFGYRALNSDLQRECYSKMEESVYRVTGEKREQGYSISRISLTGVLPEEEIRIVLAAFSEDHPEVFWLGETFSYGERAGGTVIELMALYSAAECRRMQQELLQKAEQILRGLDAGMDPFERELYLHDALLSGCVYASDLENSPMVFTAYGALVEGGAVCEGYAAAMQLLLRSAGIPCRLVNGTADGVAHAWNAVQLNEDWYHLDPTWDDMENGIRYDYFNVDSGILLLDHTISPDVALLTPNQICGTDNQAPTLFNLSLPDCGGTAENYFTRCAIRISGLGADTDQIVAAEIAGKIEQGWTSISFQIDTGLDYDNTVGMLFERQPYKILYYLTEANRRTGGARQVDLGQVRYTQNKNQRAVTVVLTFLQEQNG